MSNNILVQISINIPSIRRREILGATHLFTIHLSSIDPRMGTTCAEGTKEDPKWLAAFVFFHPVKYEVLQPCAYIYIYNQMCIYI